MRKSKSRNFSIPENVANICFRRDRKRLWAFALIVLMAAAVYSKPQEETWTEKTLKTLSLREKIAQLIQIRAPGKFINRRSSEFLSLQEQVRQNHVGGVVLFAGNVYESAILLNEIQAASKLPLLVSADFERGAAFRISDTTSFPWTMALGAAGSEELSYRQGLVTAQESRALGVHWIFAPVVDVNNNPDNPVINIRSFGEDPGLVARLGSAFIRGARKGGVLTTAKHFPGHGDTAVDSHVGLPVVQSDLPRLQSVEFVPFRSAIEAGVDSIMTAHVAVPRVSGGSEIPATLSPLILTGVLRDALHFQGLVVTDALEMAGVSDRYWCGLAAIRAIQAGADILLLPPDATVAINEVERAVQRGDISPARIEQSVRKILDAKNRLGLPRNRLTPIHRIGDIVASPQSAALAQEIADRAVTVVKDKRRLLPINVLTNPKVFSLVLASDLESSPGAAFQAEMRKRFPSLRTAWGNARIPDELTATIDKAVSESDAIVCATLVRLTSGQDTISIPENQRAIFKKLIAARKPLIWIAFGNPYVLRLAPEIGTYLCTFSYSDGSQVAAARAIAGEIDITGKMPVSIPGCAKVGDGLRIPKLETILTPVELETLGLPKNAFEKSKRILSAALDAGVIPGAQLIAGYQGKIALDLAIGKTGFQAHAAAVSQKTIYNLGSLSKLMSVAPGIMLATESGSVLLNAPVKDYVPEFKGLDTTRIRELLTASPPANEIGDSGRRMDLLKTILARASGMTWDRFLAKRLFEPMGMKNTHANPATHPIEGRAFSEEPAEDALFSNAADVAAFAQMMLNQGFYNHRRYFRPETAALWTGQRGFWLKPADSDWTSKLSASAFGGRSALGSLIWIDPEMKLFLVLLANAPRRSVEGGTIREFQNALGESILEEMVHARPSEGQ